MPKLPSTRALRLWLGLGLVIAVGTGVLAGPSRAEDARHPVVIEFFTSQGCSSCPPADEIFARLARDPGVIALALHVDYWDYAGWKDTFGDPAFTARQRAYAKAHEARSIFTPQMIVEGADIVIGHDEPAIRARIGAHAAVPDRVRITLERSGPTLDIRLAPREDGVGPADVHVIEILPRHAVTVEAGENAGYYHEYVNIVTGWVTIPGWDGSGPIEFRHDIAETATARDHAVIVQSARHGPILGAVRSP